MARIYGAREDDLLRDDSEDLAQRLYKLIPVQTQDILAMVLFLAVLPIAFVFEMFVVVGDFYTPWSNPWLLRIGVLSVLFFNTYVNYVYVIRIGPNGKNPLLPSVVQAGFRYCHSCHAQAPPRAFHCPVCDRCSFRRDHHCSFAAVCIGHFNQRYFIAAVVNLWIVAATCMVYNWSWLSIRMGNFSVIQYWQIVVPHLALLLKIISFHQFCCILVFAFSSVIGLFVTYLVAAQVYCMWRGQTRVEYLLDIHAYHLGFLNNIKQCMGANWWLALWIPFIPSPLPSSNGMAFETREMEKHASSKSL